MYTQPLKTYKTHLDELVQQVSDALAYPHSTDQASRALAAVLRAIRNRLELEPAIQFLNQLPLPLKAIFLDHWNIQAHTPNRLSTFDDLIDEVVQEAPVLFKELHHDRGAVKQAITTIFSIIRAHTENDLADLPNGLNALVEPPGALSEADSSIWLP